MKKYTKANIKAAKSLVLNIALMGGPNLIDLGNKELVDRMFQMCGALSEAAKKAGVTADEAKSVFTLMSKAMRKVEAFNVPPKNTVVSVKDLIEICKHYGLKEQIKIIENDPPKKPFKSDGASCFPDEINGVDIYPAAFLHDVAYWCGYPEDETGRLTADKRLERDVVELCGGSEMLGWIMYQGVRVGGRADSPMPWRWGFGR